jgi:hypothetical protein
MAVEDQKIEAIEEEIKVLKGEVRRTLVDLRALVMREDSPLSEHSLGRRAVLDDLAPADEMPATRKESTETIRQETNERPAAAEAGRTRAEAGGTGAENRGARKEVGRGQPV